MVEPTAPLSIGARVRFYRRQNGWTQHGLAQRLTRSVGWVRNIEQGRRQVDSTTVILELAEVLGVEPNKLTGRPLFPMPDGPKMPEPSGVVADLRHVLLHYDGIHGLDRPDGRPPRPLGDLEADVALAEQTRRRDPRNLSAVVWMLPELIRDARHVARHAAEGTADRRRAWGLLVRLYSQATGALWQWGDDDLGWIAADRAMTAAEQADDPLMTLVGIRTMQQALLSKGHLGDMIDLTEAAHRRVPPSRGMPAEQLVLVGGVQLAGAFAAARSGDLVEHAELRRRCEETADRLGSDRLVIGNNFGPGDVALQHVGELVELGQPAKALRRAEELPADPLPEVDRRAFHRIHQAKARYLQRRDRETTELLLQAWEIAPELTPNEQMTVEMIRAMAERARYRYNPNLRILAARVGIA
jgi:transcriptional regulator with XRE-family HTH domain